MLSEQEEKEKLEAEAKAKTEAEAAEKAKWDEQQQRADQEAANASKARDRAEQAESELETARSDNETLKEQLAEAEAKAEKAGIQDVDLDESQYDGTDLALVKSINILKQQLEDSKKEMGVLKKKAAGYEERERRDQAKLARNSAYEELLADLDGEYGADCRNEAVQKFNELCDKGEVPKGNPGKATRALEKCYKEVRKAKKDAKDKKEKSSLSLDTGSGGGSAPNLSGANIKEGSLEEVHAQYAAISNTK